MGKTHMENSNTPLSRPLRCGLTRAPHTFLTVMLHPQTMSQNKFFPKLLLKRHLITAVAKVANAGLCKVLLSQFPE